MKIVGTAADDILDGTNGPDTFILTQGGNDIATGEDGNDTFKFGAAFDAADHVDGGAGSDTVALNGDYTGSNAVTLGPSTLVSIEHLLLKGGHSYDLTTNDATVGAGDVLHVDATGLGVDDTLVFDGSAESNGSLYFVAGQGTYDLTGGNANNGQHDHFYFGPNFTDEDRIDGGLGVDHLKLDGNYTGARALSLDAGAMANIEVVKLHGGNSYQIGEAQDGAFGANALPVTFSAFRLNSGDSFRFDGSIETSVVERVFCGEGTFNISLGSGPKNIVAFGGEFGSADTVSGNGGNDTLGLNAAYFIEPKLDRDYTGSNSLVIDQGQMRGIAALGLTGGFSYNITMASGSLIDGDTLTVNADGYSFLAGGGDNSIFATLRNTDRLVFDGSAIMNGHLVFDIAAGLYHLTGGEQSDTFNFFTKLTRAKDIIDGSGGNDTVHLSGGADIAFNATTMSNVETISLGAGHDYTITTSNLTVAAHKTLTVDASALGAGAQLTFGGAAETSGHFVILSGNGGDDLTGGAARDTFAYDDGIALSGATRDTIHAFDFSNDVVQFASVTGIDPMVISGSVSSGTFDGDLAGLFGAGEAHELGAHHAVLFTASGGNLIGQTFLIVDGDGTAGYTAGSDLVIQLDNPLHTGSISAANFIS